MFQDGGIKEGDMVEEGSHNAGKFGHCYPKEFHLPNPFHVLTVAAAA